MKTSLSLANQHLARFIGLNLLLGLLVGSGCQGAAENTPQPVNGVAESARNETLSPVARVNNQPISRDVYERELMQKTSRYERAQHEVSPELLQRIKANIIAGLIDQELIRQQVATLGITPPQEALDTGWVKYKQRYGSDEAYLAFLERAGTTTNDLRRSYEHNVLREVLFRRLSEGVSVSGAEVRAHFEANRAQYGEPERVKAQHILFRLSDTASKGDVRAKRKLAQRVRRLAIKRGRDFGALAEKYGEDSTKLNAGDLGYFPRGQMAKAFEDAVWPLKIGEVSRVVRTPFGFHVIKKTDHQAAQDANFEGVAEHLERGLLSQKQNDAIRGHLETWKLEAEVEILIPLVTPQDNDEPNKLKRSPIPGLTIPTSSSGSNLRR